MVGLFLIIYSFKHVKDQINHLNLKKPTDLRPNAKVRLLTEIVLKNLNFGEHFIYRQSQILELESFIFIVKVHLLLRKNIYGYFSNSLFQLLSNKCSFMTKWVA